MEVLIRLTFASIIGCLVIRWRRLLDSYSLYILSLTYAYYADYAIRGDAAIADYGLSSNQTVKYNSVFLLTFAGRFFCPSLYSSGKNFAYPPLCRPRSLIELESPWELQPYLSHLIFSNDCR